MALPGRTTTAAVMTLMLNDVDPSVTDLSPWIDFANDIVTDCCAIEPTYDATRLEKIERALSAHIYCITDPRTRQEGVSGVSASYEGNTTFLLNSSRFGQLAQVIDTQGYLSTMTKLMEEGHRRRKLGVLWIGGGSNPQNTSYYEFPSSQLDSIDQGGWGAGMQ